LKTEIDLRSAVGEWTKHKFNFRSSFYTGRGSNSGDLDSSILEMIYQGLKRDVGVLEAANFAKFVNHLTDLSASAFIQAFEQFWATGCGVPSEPQRKGTGNQLTGRDEEQIFEGLALIGSALGGPQLSPAMEAMLSQSIKAKFVYDHKEEINN